jgi:hypothetical protein
VIPFQSPAISLIKLATAGSIVGLFQASRSSCPGAHMPFQQLVLYAPWTSSAPEAIRDGHVIVFDGSVSLQFNATVPLRFISERLRLSCMSR